MTPAGRGRVVVLAGPSGAGKSRLADRLHARHGWPVVRLDDFYRDGSDPGLPMRDLGGSRIVDWDDPASWDLVAAVAALERVVCDGVTPVPVYDLGRSAVVGTAEVRLADGELVVAEGIFAAEVVGALRGTGLLHSAWCVRRNPSVTFVLRLTRDLAERRKPPLVLWRRGLALCRAEPAIVARMEALGTTCATPSQVQAEIEGASAAAR